MTLLIDTTTNPSCIGFWNGKKLRAKTIESNPENNKKLVAIIKKFLNSLEIGNWELGINSVGVISGPGTFTGVRTGVTIANTIAYALNVPIYSIDTLSAQIPYLKDPKGLKNPINNVVSLISASNNEVYCARFEKGKMIGKIEIVNIVNNLKNRLKKGDLIMGDLRCEHAQLLKDQDLRIVTSKERVEILLQMIINNKIRPQKMALPIYIKKPNITKSNKKKLS